MNYLYCDKYVSYFLCKLAQLYEEYEIVKRYTESRQYSQ